MYICTFIYACANIIYVQAGYLAVVNYCKQVKKRPILT